MTSICSRHSQLPATRVYPRNASSTDLFAGALVTAGMGTVAAASASLRDTNIMNETVSIIISIILKGEAAGYHRKIGHEVGAEATNKAPHVISRRTGTGAEQPQYLQGVFQSHA